MSDTSKVHFDPPPPKKPWFFESRNTSNEAPWWTLLKAAIVPGLLIWMTFELNQGAKDRDLIREKKEKERAEEQAKKAKVLEDERLAAEQKRADDLWEAEKKLETRRQKAQVELELLRQITLSQDKADAAQLVAIAMRLAMHLHRFDRYEKKDDPEADFDRKSAFFFYGLFRARKVDFYAKGSVLFRRLWIEQAFQDLLEYIANHIAGGSELDLKISLKEEAVLYKNYGGTTSPQLIDTVRLLNAPAEADSAENKDLRLAYLRFKNHLAGGGLKINKIALSAQAMSGILPYSINTLLPETYALEDQEPPQELPKTAPPDFRRVMGSTTEAGVDAIWKFLLDLRSGKER